MKQGYLLKDLKSLYLDSVVISETRISKPQSLALLDAYEVYTSFRRPGSNGFAVLFRKGPDLNMYMASLNSIRWMTVLDVSN